MHHSELDGGEALEDDERGAPALLKAETRVPAVHRVPSILKELAILDRELTRWPEQRIVNDPIFATFVLLDYSRCSTGSAFTPTSGVGGLAEMRSRSPRPARVPAPQT